MASVALVLLGFSGTALATQTGVSPSQAAAVPATGDKCRPHENGGPDEDLYGPLAGSLGRGR